MAKLLDDIINRFRLPDDEADSYEEEYELEEERERERREAALAAKKRVSRQISYADDDDDEEEEAPKRRRPARTPSKIVSFGGGNAKGSMNITLEKPKGFEDSGAISDKLLEGSAVVLNLEGLDPAVAQRVVDFIFGAMHAINGKYTQVSKYILIFSPQEVELSGDITDLLSQNGLEVPVINRDF